jgi:LysR family transcriptional regulator, hydrogen peroxide-inducible genes activator
MCSKYYYRPRDKRNLIFLSCDRSSLLMTLVQLTYLVAIADHGHFGRAAEACYVTQPTLSMQLMKLEEELGVTLIDRSLQPIRPTERGRQIVAQARAVLAECDRLTGLLHEEGPLAGELRVGIIPTLAAYLLPLLAPALGERYPAIVLVVEELTTAHLIDQLLAGRLDAGIVATDENRPGVETLPLFDEPFVGYVGAGHPLSGGEHLQPADLDLDNVWLLAEGHCLRDQVTQLCRRPSEEAGRRIHFESGSLETLRHLVDRVGGMTLLPLLATHFLDPSAALRIRRFDEPAPGRTVRLVRPRAGARQRLVDAFAAVVRERAGQVLAGEGPAA